MRMVAVGQLQLGNRLRAAQTFGHILAGHLEMHTAADSAFGFVNREEAAHLGEDIGEFTRFESIR